MLMQAQTAGRGLAQTHS